MMTKAKPRLTNNVVSVKKMFSKACCHLLYLNANRGRLFSRIQKKVKPDTRIMVRWDEGICSKK